MRAPDFWYRAAGWWAWSLAPLGWIFARATARRVARAPKYRPLAPIISVGNISVGGTGKTPVVMALVERLAAAQRRPVIVTRGYGGSLEGPVEVDLARHSAAEVGDEPLLLAAFAPTIVAKDRAAGARLADQSGAGVIILDDGLQNPDLPKALSLLVVDARRGFGNGFCIPAGPLREPVAAGLARVDAVLSLGEAAVQDRFAAAWPLPPGLPHIRGELTPLQTGMSWTQGRYFAFAGIGDPDKFFRTLRGLGADLVGQTALSDHQPISHALIQRLIQDAARLNAQLVTTEKDAVRLPPDLRPGILTLPVRLRLSDWAPIDDALRVLDR